MESPLKVQKKNPELRAEQFFIDDPVAGAKHHEATVRRGEDGRAERVPERWLIGEKEVKPGDWVLTHPDGYKEIVDDIDFKAEYRSIDDPPAPDEVFHFAKRLRERAGDEDGEEPYFLQAALRYAVVNHWEEVYPEDVFPTSVKATIDNLIKKAGSRNGGVAAISLMRIALKGEA